MAKLRGGAVAMAGLWLIVATTGGLAQDGDSWRVLRNEQGITVSTRERAGEQLPAFRGQTTVASPVLHVLAVILDDKRSTQWAKGADEAQVLRTIDERTQLVYSRSHQTWPVRDRDLVMKRVVEVVKPAEVFRVRLTCMKGEKPPLPRVIRITNCETLFVLRKVDDQHTAVDYQVHADPGGHNPNWIVRWASEDIPFDTLQALTKQLTRTRGTYAQVEQYWRDAQ